MNKTAIIITIIIAAVLGTTVYLMRVNKPELTQNSPTPTATPSATASESPTLSPSTTSTPNNQEVTIRYTNTGYNPNSVNVSKGAKVTFVNEGSGLMWPASAVHPTHDILPGFDALKGLAVGAKYSFTFTKPGTWKFHDHLKPQYFGQVIVE